MTKEKQFKLAKQLRDGGLSFSKVAKIVAEIAKRDKPYSTSTICGWNKFETYKEYCDYQIKRQTEIIARKKANNKVETTTNAPTKEQSYLSNLAIIERQLTYALTILIDLKNSL